MTNDELKALCESNAKAIQALANSTSTALQGTNATLDRIAVQRTTHTDEIDTLLGAVSSNEVACRELRQTVESLVSAIGEGNQRFDNLRADAIADRQAFREQAETAIADRQAFREQAETDRQKADANQQNWQANFNAQMEVMRSQLVEMSRINRRLDNLEQAS